MSALATFGRICALSSAALRNIIAVQTHSLYKLVTASGALTNAGAGLLRYMEIDAAIVNTTTGIAYTGIAKTVLVIAHLRLTHRLHPIGIASDRGTLSLCIPVLA